MYRELWKLVHRSVCSIIYLKNNERIASGSGFKVGQKLITNNHVIQVPDATDVLLRFVNEDGFTDFATKRLTVAEFRSRLLGGMSEDSWDYAILDLNFNEFNKIPSLQLCAQDKFEIGQTIALLGFQFDQPNLSLHSGILSSRYVNAAVRYLQLDASVNHGNSGGPLIDPKTSQVIGIVTRKMTGLTQHFDELLKSFSENIRILEQAERNGRIKMFGINPIEFFRISQNQMGGISLEIKRSANVGVGYAYELEKIRENLNYLDS